MIKLNKLVRILLAVMMFAAISAFAQDAVQQEAVQQEVEKQEVEKQEAVPQDESVMTEEMMQKWMAASTPGEHQQWLSAFSGNWTSENKAYFDPKGEPMVSTGTSSCEMVLGGRFLKVESSQPVMDMQMNGIGYLGYDNVKKEYSLFWIDNMSTTMYTAAGQREGNVLTLLGKMDEPMTGEMNKDVKYVYTFKNANTYHFAIYDLVGTPNEFVAMEQDVTRILTKGISTPK